MAIKRKRPPHRGQARTSISKAEYAPLCELMGRSPIAPEAFNCSAPDTGNMEVLVRYGTPAQQDRWLKPLLAGEIRSCFAMTEPAVASSDATNVECRIRRDDDHYVIDGHKWWTSGAMDPRCEIAIVMGKTGPTACSLVDGGEFEEERGGEPDGRGGREAVAELDRHQRVEAELLQRALGQEGAPIGDAQGGGDLGADQLEQRALAVLCRQRAEALLERRGRRGVGGEGTRRVTPHQSAEHLGQDMGVGTERRGVELRGDQRGVGPGEGGIEQREPLVREYPAQATSRHAPEVGLGEMYGQAGPDSPEAPGEREGGQPAGLAMLGERIEERVGGVIGLAGTALEMLSTILADGRASQIYRSLIYERQLALDAGGDYSYFSIDPNLFWFWATPMPGQTPDKLETKLMAEMERLKQEPVTGEELQRAKNQIEAGFVFQQDSVFRRASLLGRFETIGSYLLYDAFIARIRAVTAADVQRVAKAYFPPDKKNAGTLLPRR